MQQRGIFGDVKNGGIAIMAVTWDGSDITWAFSRVSEGLKMVGPCATDPCTGGVLFSESGNLLCAAHPMCI